MLRTAILVALLRLSSATASPEETSYARVAKNGQLARSSHDSFSWIGRPLIRNSTSAENDSVKDVVITVSPVYVSPKIPKLKKGEVVDLTVEQSPRYSTLDREMLAMQDSKKQIQHRFHPPVNFPVREPEQPANGKPQRPTGAEYISDINASTFPGPSVSGAHNSPPGFLDDELSEPVFSKYPPPMPTKDEIPDSYKPPPNKYQTNNDEDDADYAGGFDVPSSSYESARPPETPVKHSSHYDHPPPTFPFASYGHHDDFHHHDVIYDHAPEYHHEHYHHTITTEEPEMNDQRLDKRPYSYYFIGKKLWYIPLYFSIYFVIYIAALVLKSIARHKINLPAHLADVANHHQRRSERSETWWTWAEGVLEGAERFAETYGNSRRINVG